MIRVEGLTFSYPGGLPPVFQNFDWNVAQGETWAILGPSGCGKTTLLYLLAGLRRPSQCRISVCGQPPHRTPPHTDLIPHPHRLLTWTPDRADVALGPSVRNHYGAD